MCERSSLFLPEAKSILFDLLNRTFELFDLSLYLIEHYHLFKYLSEREQQRTYRHYSLHKPCRLNYNILSDLDKYLHRLYTSCRLTKSNLRSLHAARITSSNDYIVIDDEIYELIKLFKSKLNQFQSLEKPLKITDRRYHSQRLVHNSQAIQSFVFHPETSMQKNNSQRTILSSSNTEYQQILTSFKKISQFYHLLIEQLYGVHIVRDSHILQPIVINIIRLLVFITNELKEKFQMISPIKINRNHFSVQQHEEVCQENKKILSSKPQFKLIEIQSNYNDTLKSKNDDTNIELIRNDNHSSNRKEDEESLLEFDEDEFYRLANLQRDN